SLGEGVFKMEKDVTLQSVLENVEEQLIRRALEETGGNQTKAAERLGISRHTLIYKLKKMQCK
ncbi:helix-turn-helix domain-containing protein, partial [Ammoniphilus sp. 3BR4]|uniref:helix-turn-helix domain-containing protein n=1 Tax=Ammoniphilus sp. 3BR4 TaxID=3158265 RepID=UPI003467305B